MSEAATRKVTALAIHCFAAVVAFADPAHRPSSPTSIYSPASTPAQSIYGLSLFVLAITAIVFVLVFGLLAYAVIKSRDRAHDDKREPPQVYGSSQVEAAWTVIPVLIVMVLFLATARLLSASILCLPAILAVNANALRLPAQYRDPHRVDLSFPSRLEHCALRGLVHSFWRTPLPGLLLCVAALMVLQPISMQGQSHVSEPAVNLGDTSFLDAPAGPGFVAEEIGDAAHDGTIADSAGNAVPDASAVNSISSLTHVAWISPEKLLGGWYGVEIVLSAAHVNAGATGEAGGLGNTTVSPFILQWPERRVLGMAIDQRVVADFDLPTGQYSRTSDVNISSNAFTVHPYYSITVFPEKRIEMSWRVHYLWNSMNTDPPISTGAQSTQAGQAIHFNATAAYNLYKGLWIGPNAYYIKQITDGKIDGVTLNNSPEQVGAIGPGMVWNHRSWFSYANGYQEFAAQNRATGHKLVLRIEKTF